MIAILDANVLYPALMRDILLTFAQAGLFQPKWTATIQEEWTRNLLANRPQITQSAIAHTIDAMNRAFPDAEITNYLPLIDNLTLPDPDDRHILAAAIKAEATHIVTANTKHFPQEQIAAYDLEVSHPDDFISEIIHTRLTTSHLAFKQMIARFKKPPLSPQNVINMMEKCGLPESAKLLS